MVCFGARLIQVKTALPLSASQPERDLRPFVDQFESINLVARTSDNE